VFFVSLVLCSEQDWGNVTWYLYGRCSWWIQFAVNMEYGLLIFQKLKMLQISGSSAQPTVAGSTDHEAALTRLAPEGASSNSVSLFCIRYLMTILFCFWFFSADVKDIFKHCYTLLSSQQSYTILILQFSFRNSKRKCSEQANNTK